MPTFVLTKEERICRRNEVEQLFAGQNHAAVVYPLRAVFQLQIRKADEPGVKMMVSVPKRLFKRAVDRNRIKRQLREAYRHKKFSLLQTVENQADRQLLVAFLWIGKDIVSSREVSEKMDKLLWRIAENVAAQ
ncbi:MAG: ribonuclease P protein component [Prevotella sp.]|nr:ribonuclease P protein component [Prevotella sp.]